MADDKIGKHHGTQALKYVEDALASDRIPTFQGLCVAIGRPSRIVLDVLKNPKHEAHSTLWKAVARIEARLTEELIKSPKGVGGVAFALKQPPFNWQDRHTVETQDRTLADIVRNLTRDQKLEFIKSGKLPSYVQKF